MQQRIRGPGPWREGSSVSKASTGLLLLSEPRTAAAPLVGCKCSDGGVFVATRFCIYKGGRVLWAAAAAAAAAWFRSLLLASQASPVTLRESRAGPQVQRVHEAYFR